MSPLLKGALGLAGLGVVGTGGYFALSSSGVSSEGEGVAEEGVEKPSIKWTPAVGNFQENTIGRIYGKYLMSNEKGNEKKWEELFKKFQGETDNLASETFSNGITNSAFSENESYLTYLNQACQSIYNKEESEVPKDEDNGQDWKALWRYCSPWDPQMVWRNDPEYGENTIGKEKKFELLSTKEGDNKDLWEAKNNDFFNLTTAPTEKIFDELYSQKEQTENRPTLKDKCEEAYKVETGTADKPTADDVVKFCSMKPIAA